MNVHASHYDRGKIVASILGGSWLATPPRLQLSPDELESVAPLLLGSGAGALGWNRIRDTDLAESWAAHELRQAYRMHTLQAAVHELRIKQALTFFRSRGVEPILVKGWVIARDYPEMGLRPYGDLDLCVPASQFCTAEAAMLSAEFPDCPVDLHEGFTKLDLTNERELYGRSVTFALNDVTVRILSNEDHFRLLCVHLLRHGAWRPLWLCDIAAALSAQHPPDGRLSNQRSSAIGAAFDWDVCLTDNRRIADWVSCAVGLAHHLLGAAIEHVPAGIRKRGLPSWLVPTVLREWGAADHFRAPVKYLPRSPRVLLRELRKHWPNKIEGTVGVKGPFNELPRLPFQIGDGLSRTLKLVAGKPLLFRHRG